MYVNIICLYLQCKVISVRLKNVGVVTGDVISPIVSRLHGYRVNALCCTFIVVDLRFIEATIIKSVK